MDWIWQNFLGILLAAVVHLHAERKQSPVCDEKCSLSLVETIPLGVKYPDDAPSHPETADVWLQLITSANSSVDIASLYWSLKGSDVMPHPDPAAAKGEAVLSALTERAGRVRMRIAVSARAEDLDTGHLAQAGAIVRQLDMAKLVGAGVLHTKLILVDGEHFYLGSANMDWRSLSHVKELGIIGRNCLCLADDLAKIFSVYWEMSASEKIPPVWPSADATLINMTHPALINSHHVNYNVYLSSSPAAFSPPGRTNDLDAILHTIRSAKKFVHIAVMDYFPIYLYSQQHKFWPHIDDELRRAYVSRGVRVKLLISKWAHTRPLILPFLRSLVALNGVHNHSSIQVKLFQVPSNSSLDEIPFARVNHNKYMVTDTTALIGTSNWSADYFTNTAGISLVVSPAAPTSVLKKQPEVHSLAATGKAARKQTGVPDLRSQLSHVFMRDWESPYSASLDAVLTI